MDDRGDFGLRRLFRPPLDSLSAEQQLPYYKVRDLVPSHSFRSDPSHVGFPVARKRVIDSMNYAGPRDDQEIPRGSAACKLTIRRRDQLPNHQRLQSNQEEASIHSHSKLRGDNGRLVNSAEHNEYVKWYEERRKLRSDLDNMGLSKTWLRSKKRTPLEGKALQSILSAEESKRRESEKMRQMLEMQEVGARVTTPPRPKPPPPPPPKMPLSLPKLESYLGKNHLRLLDFFKRLDRDKDWCVTLEDLKSVVAQYKMPLSEADCSELFASFDVKRKGRISYKQMLEGVSRWSRKSTRSTSHLSHSELVPSEDQEDTMDENAATDQIEVSPSEGLMEGVCVGKEEEEAKVAVGSEVVSTLGGFMGELNAKYMQKLQEDFTNVCKLCRDQDMVLSQEVLEKALLLPPDHKREDCLSALSEPNGGALLSQHFADSAKKGNTEHHRGSLRHSFGGAYLETRGPKKGKTMQLSTGRARVHSKTDCWVSFDQYMAFARNLHPKFRFAYHGPPSHSAFWPGALLDKVRLYLDSDSQRASSLRNVFHRVGEEDRLSRSLPSKCSWPVNDAGYVQFGTLPDKPSAL